MTNVNWTIGSALIGAIVGGLLPYLFNRIPAKWFCDYGEAPIPGMWAARIKEKPWTILFILLFMASSIKLMEGGPAYQAATLLTLALLLMTSIADQKYRIIPDQFVVAIAVTALGHISDETTAYSLFLGALIGGGFFLVIGSLGRFLYKADVLGFGDVKLAASIGLVSGYEGIFWILGLTALSAGVSLGFQTLNRHLNRKDEAPLGPYLAGSAAFYLLFQHQVLLFSLWFDSLA